MHPAGGGRGSPVPGRGWIHERGRFYASLDSWIDGAKRRCRIGVSRILVSVPSLIHPLLARKRPATSSATVRPSLTRPPETGPLLMRVLWPARVGGGGHHGETTQAYA